MGIIKPYSDELWVSLNLMKPIEQWNYLCVDHAQMSEKKGVKYSEYKKINVYDKDGGKINGTLLTFEQEIDFMCINDKLFCCNDVSIYKIMEIIDEHTLIIDRELSIDYNYIYFNVL